MTLRAPSLFPPDYAVAVPGYGFEILTSHSWVFRFTRELKSPNKTIWKGRWALASDRDWWERAIVRELREWETLRTLTTWTASERAAWPHVRGHREVRALTVVRMVPTPRHFIQDTVRNLQFSIKGLEDALVRAKLLVDDRDAWLTCAPVTQQVSPDRRFYTVVVLKRPALAGAEV